MEGRITRRRRVATSEYKRKYPKRLNLRHSISDEFSLDTCGLPTLALGNLRMMLSRCTCRETGKIFPQLLVLPSG